MKESSFPDVLNLTFPALVCFIVAELEAGRVHEHDDFLFVRFWCASFSRHLIHDLCVSRNIFFRYFMSVG
jgi:hypothetical protein